MSAPAFEALRAHLRELELLDGIAGTLGWDEQTYMPRGAADLRGGQTALLARLSHERLTDPKVGRWLEALDPTDPLQAACARNLGRAFRRETRVPSELVERLARARSEGFQTWIEAKRTSDFSGFLPSLERLLALTIERARAIDATRHPYEVTLEQYDPGTTVASLVATFERLRAGLVPLLDAIAAAPQVPRLDAPFPAVGQWSLHREIATLLGYDFERGRLDQAEHPFSTGLGEGDVRITTHLYESDLLGGLGSTIHETGHALYEQGLPHALAGTTLREAASYGLHESQSRFWENYVGRSLAFARLLAPRVRTAFPGLPTPDAESIFRAQNRVERGLIRVMADEVTYNLHIIVRFELELALFEGSLAAKDLPSAWNDKYARYLGVTPPDDAHGCLQDVHWSGGSFGYFPSYTLGNLYAASLGAALRARLPDLDARIERGDLGPILAWLREHVHVVGHRLEAPEIVRAAVGERDSVADLLDYLWERMGAVYGVRR